MPPIGAPPFLAQSGADWLVPMLLIFFIFYFIMVRPASRDRKKRESQLAALKKHDRVVTNAGIHGSVVAIEDDVIVLRVDDKNNVRMRFNRQAIWQVLQPSADRPEGKKTEGKRVEEGETAVPEEEPAP